MLRLNHFLVVCFSILAPYSVTLADHNHDLFPLKEGQYSGYIIMNFGADAIQRATIPTEMNVIRGPTPLNSPDDMAEMRAFITTRNGGWQSHEYITHTFVIPDFIWSVGRLSFMVNNNSQAAMSLRDGVVLEDGNLIVGEVLFNGVPDTGFIVLKHESTKPDAEFLDKSQKINDQAVPSFSVLADLPVVPAISGEYLSESGREIVQLEAVKLSTDVQGCMNPLAGYMVNGRHGEKRASQWIPERAFGLENTLVGLNYELHYQRIYIPEVGACRVSQEGLMCGEYSPTFYARQPGGLDSLFVKPTYERPKYIPEIAAPTKEEELASPLHKEDVAGHFRGKLHIERMDKYVVLDLTVDLSGKPSESHEGLPQEQVSLQGFMVAGAGDSDVARKIPVVFEPRTFPQVMPFSGLVLPGKEEVGKDDPTIHITQWTKERIIGVWFSKTANRVGQFELKRAPRDHDIACDNCLPNIKGRYRYLNGGDHEQILYMRPVPDHSHEGLKSFPYILMGNFEAYHRKYSDIKTLDSFLPGRYDPFTGHFYLKAQSGRVATGKITTDGINAHFVDVSPQWPHWFERYGLEPWR